MTRYILDTDHITLYREGNVMVQTRIATLGDKALHVTIISFQEQIEGWFAEIRRARDQHRLLWAYSKLHQTFRFFTRMQMLPFDEPAATHSNSYTNSAFASAPKICASPPLPWLTVVRSLRATAVILPACRGWRLKIGRCR